MVSLPQEWPWSSDGFSIKDQLLPPWFDTDWLLGQLGTERQSARSAFAKFVLHGVALASPLLGTKHQLLLGDAQFVEQHRRQLPSDELREVSIAHRRAIALPLDAYQKQHSNRNDAMAQAYRSGAYAMAEIAAHFQVHYITVSRAVRALEKTSGESV